MAWESRSRGGRYYTRSRRIGGRVVREYVGRGLLGELAEREDRAEREARAQATAVRQQQRRRQQEEDRALRELVIGIDRQAATLTAITLAAAGYHRPKRGVWRRRRGHGSSQAG